MKRFLVAVFFLSACRTSPPVKPGNVVAPTNLDRGAVAAKLLPDPASPNVRLGPGEEYVPPQFTPGNPLPEYPAALLGLRLPPHTVVVRMVVDEARRIADISASPLQESTASKHLPAFEAAVRSALQKWSVWPPAIRKFKPGPDSDDDGNADYQVLVDQRIFKAYFDLAFTFEVVNGQGVVRSALPD